MGVSAAILAGGQARRLGGAEKPLLVIDAERGTRIIDRQLRELHGVAGEILIVTNAPEKYADLGVRCVGDVIAGAGPLGGLYSALMHAAASHVLVLAGDLPFISRAFLQRLVGEMTATLDAVVPRSSRGFEPLCAIYAKRAADALKQRIEAGQLKIESAVHELKARELGPDVIAEYDHDGRLFDNINTPHDYARARATRENTMENRMEPLKDRITE